MSHGCKRDSKLLRVLCASREKINVTRFEVKLEHKAAWNAETVEARRKYKVADLPLSRIDLASVTVPFEPTDSQRILNYPTPSLN